MQSAVATRSDAVDNDLTLAAERIPIGGLVFSVVRGMC
jgi:hypothetical protein